MSDDNVTPLFPTVHDPLIADGANGRRTKQDVTATRVTRAKARHRVLQLAAAGVQYAEIAEHMKLNNAPVGKTEKAVGQIVGSALRKWAKDNTENIAEYRERKLMELEVLKRALWGAALAGDTDSVKEARQIIKTQAVLSGAAAPQKVEHKHEHSLGLEENEIRAMETAWVNAAPMGELPPGEDIIEGEVVE